MRYEPAINKAGLLATIREAHGLAVERLTFVPVGFAAVCYVLHAAGGERFFLKLWPRTRAGREAAARQEVVLPLLRALAGRGLLPRVPVPIPTHAGALLASSAAGPFALFPFLDGHPLPVWSACPPALRQELARTIAAIHRATPTLAEVLPARETLGIPFEDALRRGLAALEWIGSAARPGQRALRNLVLPRRAEIVDCLARLHDLSRRLCCRPGPMVLCHTDLGGDNLIVGAQGHLWVLDWDDATVAPPEHDLSIAVGDGLGPFLAAYTAAGGAATLYLDHFAFSLQRRYLADLAARLLRILEEEGSPPADEEALAGIVEWGFDPLARLDTTLADIAATLPTRGEARGSGASTGHAHQKG